MELIYKNELYKIIGACLEVHNSLGCGFLESVYHEALKIEFKLQDIDYKHEVPLLIKYKGIILPKTFQADFICYDKIILELKATSELTSKDEAQVLNYLNATGFKLGILVNFGEKSLKYKRLVL